jgi:hypothetical protein
MQQILGINFARLNICVMQITARVTHIHTKEKNMSKTPYEIRLELLNLAKEILQTPIYQTREAKLQEYHSKLTDANRESHPFPTLPDFPSSTDIVAKAEELKKFIDAA